MFTYIEWLCQDDVAAGLLTAIEREPNDWLRYGVLADRVEELCETSPHGRAIAFALRWMMARRKRPRCLKAGGFKWVHTFGKSPWALSGPVTSQMFGGDAPWEGGEFGYRYRLFPSFIEAVAALASHFDWYRRELTLEVP